MFAVILGFFTRTMASRLFLPIILSIAVGVVFTTGYVKGHNSCVAKQTKAELKLEKKRDKIEQNVSGLDDKQLDERLRKFFRD